LFIDRPGADVVEVAPGVVADLDETGAIVGLDYGTGSPGLAGLLQLQRDGVEAPGDKVAVIFSGGAPRPSA